VHQDGKKSVRIKTVSKKRTKNCGKTEGKIKKQILTTKKKTSFKLVLSGRKGKR